jgi:hypothetical protein
MATKYSYLYLGFLDDDSSVIKIGRTSQTCKARCKNADYTIYYGIRLFKQIKNIDKTICCEELSIPTLNSLEQLILSYYRQNYKLNKGFEYFNNKDKDFNFLKKEFEEIVNKVLKIVNDTLPENYKIIQPHPRHHYYKNIEFYNN